MTATNRLPLLALVAAVLATLACSSSAQRASAPSGGSAPAAGPTTAPTPVARSRHAGPDARPVAPPLAAGQAEAIFAGGCFWCMEKPFESVPGVVSVTSGFTGGHAEGATYEEVSRGGTGHFESVRVVYDPTRVSYAALLDVFLHNVDPTQGDGQFCDRGDQYRSAIFVHDARERAEARAALDRAHTTLGRRVVTQILDVVPFYVAEDYHQDFYRTHPARYASYREGCGRDARLRSLWGESAGH